jgi:hypothetical protein
MVFYTTRDLLYFFDFIWAILNDMIYYITYLFFFLILTFFTNNGHLIENVSQDRFFTNALQHKLFVLLLFVICLLILKAYYVIIIQKLKLSEFFFINAIQFLKFLPELSFFISCFEFFRRQLRKF